MSFLFGSGRGLPAIDQRAFGLQVARANTNQQARPVPLLYGKTRVGITFISDVFDELSIPITQDVGKQSSQVGNNFYASFAGNCGIGNVAGLFDIFLNGEPVFASQVKLVAVSLTSTGTPGQIFYTATFQTRNPHGLADHATVIILGADQPEYNGEFPITVISPTQFQYFIVPTDASTATSHQSGAITAQVKLDPVLRDNDNPDFADITIPDYGVMRIYWGTETQPQDTYLNTKSGVVHPAYLGQCWVVFHQLFFGFNQTNVPNVELVLAVWPVPSWGGNPASIEDDANPAYVIADLFENPRAGLALADSDLDTAAFETAATQFNAEQIGISQALSRAQDVRSILTAITETVDVLPVLDAAMLLSLLPIRPPGGAVPPQISDSDLADLPQFTPTDWTTTYSQTRAVFNNQDIGYQDDDRDWRDLGGINVIRNPDALTLDRHWITRSDLAQIIANVAGQAAAIPSITGSLKVRYTDFLFNRLTPGSLFTINTALRDCSNLYFRVTSREIPDPGQPEFEIQFQADRTYLYSALEPSNIGNIQSGAVIEPPPPVTPPPPVPIPVNAKLIIAELPAYFGDGAPAVAALAARDSQAVTGFSLWLNKNFAWRGAPPDSYSQLLSSTKFAFYGTTQNDYPPTTAIVDLLVGVQVQLESADQVLNPVTAFDAISNNVLVFINGEICSLAGWTLQGSGLYQLYLVRGRYGTPIVDQPAGSGVMIINRADLAIAEVPNLKPGVSAQFKLAVGVENLSDLDALDVAVAGVAWRVPAPCALQVNGRSVNPSFPGGATPLTVSWILPSPGGTLPFSPILNLYTRLQFFVGATMIYQTDIAWPTMSQNFVFNTLSAHPDQNFTLKAYTLTNLGWAKILSATPATLNVLKLP